MFLWSKAWPVRRADNLTAICEPIVFNVGSLTCQNPYFLLSLYGAEAFSRSIFQPRIYSRKIEPVFSFGYSQNGRTEAYLSVSILAPFLLHVRNTTVWIQLFQFPSAVTIAIFWGSLTLSHPQIRGTLSVRSSVNTSIWTKLPGVGRSWKALSLESLAHAHSRLTLSVKC
jgi:hypothetical protein